MTDWTTINAAGSTVISFLTLIASAYLLISLTLQGRGKLRVRLLLGLVTSDLVIAVAVLPTEIAFLAGHPVQTGTAACNAGGFFVTAILFTQHLWTLTIAVATFLLLKHPLSNVTTLFEKYSWAVAPIIWGISLLHSGIWQAKVGWLSSGSLCYYGSKPIPNTNIDQRDLIQFIPRAIVFVTIVSLYSMLFNFLRRPDTIQLSTQFMSGSPGPTEAYDGAEGGAEGGGGGGGGVRPKLEGSRSSSGGLLSKALRVKVPRISASGRSTGNVPVNPDAPWESLEFVQVGRYNPLLSSKPSSPVTSQTPYFNPVTSVGSAGGILLNSRPASVQAFTPSHEITDPLANFAMTPHTRRQSALSIFEPGPPSTVGSQRPSEADTIVTPELTYHSRASSEVHILSPPSQMAQHILSPVISDGKSEFADHILSGESSPELKESGMADPLRSMGGAGDGERRPSQTLREFFEEYQIDNHRGEGADPTGTRGGGGSGNHGVGGGRGSGGIQMSATAYFNRQASLLMLYFPLAYMVVFSVSLVRLVYDMVNDEPSKLLSLISAWMVLSVGLIDGLVYGLAEFLVKRRVRRKMPDRMG